MNKHTRFIRILAISSLVLAVTLACGFFPNFQNIGDQVKERVLETVGGISTEVVGNIQSTADVVTGDIQLTAEALMGEMSPEIQATLAAIPPDINIGEAPADIPVLPDPYGFAGGEKQVIYMTTTPLDEAVQFYRQEMPANGWQETEPSLVLPKMAYINFEKDGRQAIITMTPAGDKLAISIIISEK